MYIYVMYKHVRGISPPYIIYTHICVCVRMKVQNSQESYKPLYILTLNIDILFQYIFIKPRGEGTSSTTQHIYFFATKDK